MPLASALSHASVLEVERAAGECERAYRAPEAELWFVDSYKYLGGFQGKPERSVMVGGLSNS